MKNNKWLILLASLVCLVFSACNDNEDVTPIGKFENGVLVVNEGNFGEPNGSLSFYHVSGDSVTNNVVDQQNGSIFGATLISSHKANGKVYLVTNQPDKVEVIGEEDFKFVTTPISGTDISQPRFMTVVGNKGYVSCWGPWGDDWDLPDSYVAVIDLSSNTVVKKIDVADGAEGIIAVGNKVFVAGSYSDGITVINTDDDEIVATIESPSYAPTDFVVDANQKLWVICKGSGNTSGSLLRINPADNDIEINIEIEGEALIGKFAINGSGNTIYYLTAAAWPETGSKLFEFSISDTTPPSTALISGNNFYGIGIDPDDNTIYIGDSRGFSSEGKVLRYKSNGTHIGDFEAGVGPNSFNFFR